MVTGGWLGGKAFGTSDPPSQGLLFRDLGVGEGLMAFGRTLMI